MKAIDKALLLKKNSTFSTLSLESLLPLAEKLVEQKVPAGERIFDRDEEPHALFFIANGSICLEKEASIVKTTLGESDYFGDLALFASTKRTKRATASEDSLLLVLSKRSFFATCHEHPSLCFAFLKQYATALI